MPSGLQADEVGGSEEPRWEPMQDDYNSRQNLLFLDAENPLAFHLGVKGLGEITTISETPCKFYPGFGDYCWKGHHCRYKHVLGQVGNDFSGALDLGKERIQTVMGLDEKPRIDDSLAALRVKVTHVVSPSEFYVMPLKDWKCECTEAAHQSDTYRQMRNRAWDALDPVYRTKENMEEEIEKLYAESQVPPSQGVEAYQTLQQSLNECLNKGMLWRKLQNTTYQVTELVAVKVEGPSGKMQWSRAEVIDEDVKCAIGRELPWFVLRLIDVGLQITVRADAICKLPALYCYSSAKAFKCSLYGAFPVRMIWNAASKDMFTSLVVDKTIYLTVKFPSPKQGILTTLEAVPYLVDLTVCEPGKPSVHVEEALVDAGKAIRKNLFPHRSALNEFIGPGLGRLLAPLHPKPVSKEDLDIEAERLKKIIEHDTEFKDESDNKSDDESDDESDELLEAML